MPLSSRVRLALLVGLSLALLSLVASSTDAQDAKADTKFEKKKVTFNTVDAVELTGTLWTPKANKKNAAVLLLHNFSRTKGGNRNDDGWNALGNTLATEGYVVLSFDFRGYGESTTVGKEFWNRTKFPFNQVLLKPPVPKEAPTKIDYKNFPAASSYAPYLVNDIAAAKAYLNDKFGAEAGNLVVLGAGEGATLGAMWMTAEYRLFRDKNEGVALVGQPVNPEAEPEGKDIACGIWLTLSGSLDLHAVPAATWLEEVGGKKNKVPMLFIYGKDDPKAKLTASTALTKMMPGYKLLESGPGLNTFDTTRKFTRDWAIEGTKLDGSQLLQESLNTNSIITAYLNKVLEDRGSKEAKRHEASKFRYFWLSPTSRNPIPAKIAGEEFMQPITPTFMGMR